MRTIQELLAQMTAGNRLALARLISIVEDRAENLPEIIEKIYPQTGRATILGITGPPGAGKSTITDKLVAEIRKQGKRVAVICIDPSSPFSGGAILGDRIRMQSHTGDQGVYIRSVGTRGKHGGLSETTREVALVLDAAGFDWIIIETAGVGQTELDILKLAHIICVVLVPESGDGIQVMKAGLMEIADIFAVNKSDRPEADTLVRELVTMVALNQGAAWKIPVLKTQASFGKGIEELFTAIASYKEFAAAHGILEAKKAAFLEEEILDIVWRGLHAKFADKLEGNAGRALVKQVLDRKRSPYSAARTLMSATPKRTTPRATRRAAPAKKK